MHREIVNEGAAAMALSEKRLREQSDKLREQSDKLRDQSDKAIEKLRQRLELETHKLEDCHREIENYRVHFEQTSIQVKHFLAEFFFTEGNTGLEMLFS